jgi:TonB family protein
MMQEMTSTAQRSNLTTGRGLLIKLVLTLFFVALPLLAASPTRGQAQKPAPLSDPKSAPQSTGTESLTDFGNRPIFINLSVFQLEVDAAADPDLTDQVFRMKTSSLQDYDKWMRTFGKTYPGHKVSLLKQESRRVFRTAKPALVSISKQVDGRSIILEINGAQSPGDGVNPGTSLVAILNLQFGSDQSIKPISYSITPLEVDHGMTYFYMVKSLRMASADYARFLRPNEASEAFASKNYYLIFGISVDIDQTTVPPRYYDERQSAKLQEDATKKVPLTLPDGVQKLGLSGLIRLKVDIGNDGKVSRANVAYSTLPEANQEAIAAARQWEFPTSLFATDQNPITGFISFTVPPRKP